VQTATDISRINGCAAWLRLVGIAGILGMAVLLSAGVSIAQDRTPADDLTELRAQVTATRDALAMGDVTGAQAAYQAFDDGWEVIEDGIRAHSRDHYRAIENAMDEVKSALLRRSAPDPTEVTQALQRLDATIETALPDLR
jgi:hypothetical protein